MHSEMKIKEKGNMKTLNMPPHERMKMLRNGEKVMCKKCREGSMKAVGDFKRTNTFLCNRCGNQLIID